MNFTEPSDDDIRRLARSVLAVEQMAASLGLSGPKGNADDLPLLQRILDSDQLTPDDTFELQSLGVVFGRALVSEVDGLDWAIVHDEYGSDPTLRFGETSLCINALTIISKRIEDHEVVNVAELFGGVQELLAESLRDMRGG